MVVLPDQGLSAALLRRQLHQVTNARHVAPRQPPLAAVEGHNFVPIRHVRRRRVLRRLRLAAVMVLMLVVMVVVVVVVVPEEQTMEEQRQREKKAAENST